MECALFRGIIQSGLKRGEHRLKHPADARERALFTRGFPTIPGIPPRRGHGEPVGHHLLAVGAIAIIIDGVGAVAHRAQQLVATGTGHSPGEEVLTAPVANIWILLFVHAVSLAKRFPVRPSGSAKRRNSIVYLGTAGTMLQVQPIKGSPIQPVVIFISESACNAIFFLDFFYLQQFQFIEMIDTTNHIPRFSSRIFGNPGPRPVSPYAKPKKN